MSEADVPRKITSSLKLLIKAGARAAESLSDRPAPGEPYKQRHHELDLQALADLRFALALFEEIELKADLGLPLPSEQASAAVAEPPGLLGREVSRAADRYAFMPMDVFGHRALVVNTSICHEEVAEVLLRDDADLVITYFFSGLQGLTVQLFAGESADVGAIARRFGGSGTSNYAVLPPIDSDFNVLRELERASPPPGLWSDWTTLGDTAREQFFAKLARDTIEKESGIPTIHLAGRVLEGRQICLRCGATLQDQVRGPVGGFPDGPVTVWRESGTSLVGEHGVGEYCVEGSG